MIEQQIDKSWLREVKVKGKIKEPSHGKPTHNSSSAYTIFWYFLTFLDLLTFPCYPCFLLCLLISTWVFLSISLLFLDLHLLQSFCIIHYQSLTHCLLFCFCLLSCVLITTWVFLTIHMLCTPCTPILDFCISFSSLTHGSLSISSMFWEDPLSGIVQGQIIDSIYYIALRQRTRGHDFERLDLLF